MGLLGLRCYNWPIGRRRGPWTQLTRLYAFYTSISNRILMVTLAWGFSPAKLPHREDGCIYPDCLLQDQGYSMPISLDQNLIIRSPDPAINKSISHPMPWTSFTLSTRSWPFDYTRFGDSKYRDSLDNLPDHLKHLGHSLKVSWLNVA